MLPLRLAVIRLPRRLSSVLGLKCPETNTARPGALLNHPPVPEVDDAAAIRGILLRVRNLNYRGAAVVQLFEHIHDLSALIGVQIAGRLVGEDELGIRDDGAGYADELLLPARQLVRVESLFAYDLEPVEHVADYTLALGFFYVSVRERNI